jgi:hypothetical protein
MHYSQEWDNARHAACNFFYTNAVHSIHGSDHLALALQYLTGAFVSTLSHAGTLYQLVNSVGMAHTRLSSVGVIRPDIDDQVCRRGSGWPFWRIVSFLVALLSHD